MKRVAVLLGMAAVAPSVARAQIPIAPASTGAPATAPAPSAAPPAADAGPAPAPAAGAPAKAPPGDEYFVEQAPPSPPSPPPQDAPPFEPPTPPSYEPPPPPQAHHLAPQSALVVGARIGWFFPFGNVWAKAQPVNGSTGYVLQGVPWRDYASSGPMFELDVGARLSRSYTAFALWERAQLGSGSNDTGIDGAQDRAESDFWAVGLRASSNPDGVGFLTEVAIGYRRARTFFKNDVQYQFTDAPFEARLGLGGEYRLNRMTSFSSLVTVGVGGFGSVERVGPNGNALPLTHGLDDGDGHAWLTLTIGGHFDLIASQK